MEHSEFSVHMLNKAGIEKANKIKDVFNEFLTNLADLCAPGREFSIVKTKLEEACFFAKKSMANQEVNQVNEK
jgi:hypothetical protein